MEKQNSMDHAYKQKTCMSTMARLMIAAVAALKESRATRAKALTKTLGRAHWRI